MDQLLERLPEILASPAGQMALLVGAVGLLIMAFLALRLWHKRLIASGAHPVLVDLVHQAILKAYHASDVVFGEIGTKLRGVQKKKLADKLYNMIPSPIPFFNIGPFLPVSLPWKRWVSQEAFSDWVQQRFDAGLEDWDEFAALVRGEMAEYIDGLQSVTVTCAPDWQCSTPCGE
jgi:hypothetical protein